MSKIKKDIIKYTPYISMLVGIVIFVCFFMAGGIKNDFPAPHPDYYGEHYRFTAFQALFGKTFYYADLKFVYFKFNLLSLIIFPSLLVGLLASTINRFNYKIRNLTSGIFSLLAGLLMFLIPATSITGDGWNTLGPIQITMGAPLIIAAILTLINAATYFILAFLKE